MGAALGQWGLGLASQAVGAGMGMLLGKENDRRQLEQQQKLQDMQIKGNKEMADYSQWKQMQNWKATNYPAQIEQIKAAGLNPAMIYGMGGAGGATTGGGSQSVSGGSAPSGGGEAIAAAGMGMTNNLQSQLIGAQIENIKADTANKQADASYKGGAQTENTAQATDNARMDYELKRLDITLKNITNFEQQASQGDRLQYIETQTLKAVEELKTARNTAKLSEESYQSQLNKIKAEAIGAALRNELTKTQTGKTASDIRVNEQQINNFIQQNMREWDKMDQTNKEIQIKKMLGEYHTDPINTHSIDKIIGGLLKTIK